MNFRTANLTTGWIVFLIASIVYISTIEPTTSFWDCGEFITTAYKLEIGHPPGAPLFMLLGRMFSMFVPISLVPVSINVMSALSSSFTILFLFWTITHFALKMLRHDAKDPMDVGSMIAVMGAGVIGALAYTFSDSFWFSAVEGEVYAMSALFTAAVFWAILRWESLSDGHNEMRWIILIAFLMGLSIGVHLLNLLAIPAICFVVYFKRYKTTTKGILITGIISILILGFMQAGIIPGVVALAGRFELLFVNSFGLPFNVGSVVYGAIVIGLIIYGLQWTHKHNRPVLNTAILSVAVILLGYSTFATIVIRSSANPPLDENNPENVFSLLAYLNREQYGDRPLLYGEYWNSPNDPQNPRSDGKPVYTKAWLVKSQTGRTVEWFTSRFEAEKLIAEENEKPENKGKSAVYSLGREYIVSDDKKGSVVNYDPKFETVFPRMYSPQENHISAYKSWSNYEGKPIRSVGRDGKPIVINKPTFGENMRFFFNYQLNFMYWRYFLWNFAGRQNDIQGHGDILNGNWLSGVDFIDNQRLAPQENLPESMTSNFAYNKFYLLPFLLGLIGFFYQLHRRRDDWFVTMLLFLLTGIAIVIYLNQTPLQPRERDYAYAGSFYAYAIWIGLGIVSLFDAAKRLTFKDIGIVSAYIFGGGVVIFLLEWGSAEGTHFFSYAIFYLAFIGMGVVALMALMQRGLKSLSATAAAAVLLGLVVPVVMAAQGWDDHDRSHRYTARDFAKNYLDSCAPGAILFTNGDNDTFPLWYAQEVEGFRTDVRVVNLSLLNTDWYITQMKRKAYDSEPVPFSMSEVKYRQGTRDVVLLDESANPDKLPVNVDRAIAYISNDKNLQSFGGDKLAVLPTKNFYVEVDRDKVIENGTVSPWDTTAVVDRISWRIDRPYILKNNMMQLDLLATNDWDRPIYFAVTTGPDSYIGLENYFKLEGLAYRLVPAQNPPNSNPNLYGEVNAEVMYDNVMNKFVWGGMDGEQQIYMDENNLRMTNNLRLQFANLADKLILLGKEDKAKNVLDKAVAVMPDHNVPFDRLMIPIIESYYQVGEDQKANEIAQIIFDRYAENFEYYLTFTPEQALGIRQELQIAYMVISRVNSLVTERYPQDDIKDEINERFDRLDKAFEIKIQEMEAARTGKRFKL